MKAMLMIDVPKDVKYVLCEYPEEGNMVGKYCEVKPLPRKWTMDEVEPCAYNEGFVDGLNHCIYLITGEM